jgi:hypothetical protein
MDPGGSGQSMGFWCVHIHASQISATEASGGRVFFV